MEKQGSQVVVEFNNKTYSLPQEDTLVLPLVNISSEELARWICQRFLEKVPSEIGLKKVKTSIEETRGQAVTFVQSL